jgi:hypothetical protein
MSTDKLEVNADTAPTHSVVDLPSGSVAAKMLPYLSREGGKAYLNLLYSELVWDTSLDDGSEFTDVAGSAAQAFIAGTYYHVTSGVRTGLWYCIATTGTTTFDDIRFSLIGNILMWEDSVEHFRQWDGNGWGDNDKFTVLDNVATELDDNGQAILTGTTRVALPFLIRGDE